jgi:hypothetical protein
MQFAATCTFLKGTPMRLMLGLRRQRLRSRWAAAREHRSRAFEKGVQFFYVHFDPFLRLGLNGIKKSLGR